MIPQNFLYCIASAKCQKIESEVRSPTDFDNVNYDDTKVQCDLRFGVCVYVLVYCHVMPLKPPTSGLPFRTRSSVPGAVFKPWTVGILPVCVTKST